MWLLRKLKENWKGIASFGCGLVAVGAVPVSGPLAVGVAGACLLLSHVGDARERKASDAGKQLGELVKGKKP